jgi:hypothetical protein
MQRIRQVALSDTGADRSRHSTDARMNTEINEDEENESELHVIDIDCFFLFRFFCSRIYCRVTLVPARFRLSFLSCRIGIIASISLFWFVFVPADVVALFVLCTEKDAAARPPAKEVRECVGVSVRVLRTCFVGAVADCEKTAEASATSSL